MTDVTTAPRSEDLKFSQMTAVQRIVFTGKTIIFFCTAGFVFPTVLG
jgi:hypothetical protein